MKIYINYQGDLGSGNTELSVEEYATITECISQFHARIGIPETYPIGVGIPPFRRRIYVTYDYYINGRYIRNADMKLFELGIGDKSVVELIIGGGGKVD